jgi:hypothetical protein
MIKRMIKAHPIRESDGKASTASHWSFVGARAGLGRSAVRNAAQTQPATLAPDPRRWEGGNAGEPHAARTMAVTQAARMLRRPIVLVWALWVLVVLGLAVSLWLEDLLRRAGRADPPGHRR